MEIQWTSNFTELKKQSGLTFEQLALLTDLSTHILQRLGRGENIHLSSLIKVCLALGCILSDLIDDLIEINPNGDNEIEEAPEPQKWEYVR